MNPKLVLLIAAASALFGSSGTIHVRAQAAQATGQWQMIAGSGGDGPVAWKSTWKRVRAFIVSAGLLCERLKLGYLAS